MSEALRCDSCGTVEDEERLVDWYRVEPVGVTFPELSRGGGTYHFCGVACLAGWATRKARQ